MSKTAYRMFSAVVGIGGGMVARALFHRLWHGVTGEDRKPEPTDRAAGWAQIVMAAALEGALFAAVRVAVDRAGALSVARATGTWPD